MMGSVRSLDHTSMLRAQCSSFYVFMGTTTAFHMSSVVLVAVCTRRIVVGPREYSEISALLIPLPRRLDGIESDDTVRVMYKADEARPGYWFFNVVGV